MLPFPIISNLRVLEKIGITKFDMQGSGCLLLTSTGNLYAYGSNAGGRFGTGDTNNLSTLTLIATGVIDFHINRSHTIIFKADSTMIAGVQLYVYGITPTSSYQFIDCTGTFAAMRPIKKIITMDGFTSVYVLRTDGTLYCTGDNSNGQMGSGGTDFINSFRLLASNVKDFNISASSVFVLYMNGVLAGCGMNNNNEISSSTSILKTLTQISTGVLNCSTGYNTCLYNTSTGLYVRGYVDSYYGLSISNAATNTNITQYLPFTYDSTTFKFISYSPLNIRINFIYNAGKYYVLGNNGSVTDAGILSIGISGSYTQRKFTEALSVPEGTEYIWTNNQGFTFLVNSGFLYISGVHNSIYFPVSVSRSTVFTKEKIII